MRTIVVTTDFSAISSNAVHYAADMAVAVKADLYILHVLKVYTLLPEIPWPPEAFQKMEAAAETELQNLKTSLTNYTKNQINVITKLEAGDFKLMLEGLCNTVKPLMIVMGTTGDPVKRFLSGSNTLTAAQMNFPIMIIPLTASFHGLKKIVVACDLENLNSTIPVKYFRELYHLFNAEIYILHVHKDGFPVEKADSLKDLLKDLQPEFLFINEDNVEEGVHKFLCKNQVDLLLLLPKKHYFPMNIFTRRHSKEIILHESVPIMTIHE